MKVLLAFDDATLQWGSHVTVNEELLWVGATVETVTPKGTLIFEKIWQIEEERYCLVIACCPWDVLEEAFFWALRAPSNPKRYSNAEILWIPQWKKSIKPLVDPARQRKQFEMHSQILASVLLVDPLTPDFATTLRREIANAASKAARGALRDSTKRSMGFLDWDPTWSGDREVLRLMGGNTPPIL